MKSPKRLATAGAGGVRKGVKRVASPVSAKRRLGGIASSAISRKAGGTRQSAALRKSGVSASKIAKKPSRQKRSVQSKKTSSYAKKAAASAKTPRYTADSRTLATEESKVVKSVLADGANAAPNVDAHVDEPTAFSSALPENPREEERQSHQQGTSIINSYFSWFRRVFGR